MSKKPAVVASVTHSYTRGRVVYCILATLLACGTGSQILIGNATDVPSVSAGIGPCTADFVVNDASNKPVFDAKIHTIVKYGFMSKRDTELEIGTDSNGRAKIEGLPEKLKKPPMEFTIKKGDVTQSVTNDPAANCHPTFTVTLGK